MRRIRVFVRVVGLLLTLLQTPSIWAQKGFPAEGTYAISVTVTGISMPTDGYIYMGKLVINNELNLTIPKMRNPPFTTGGTIEVSSSASMVTMRFTGQSTDGSVNFNDAAAITWGREAMCTPMVFTFGSYTGSGAITVEVTVTPGAAFASRTASEMQEDVCESDEITLDAAPNYAWYEWEYREAGDATFRPFYNPQPEASSITFTMEDIYGPDYVNKFGNDHGVYVRMHIGVCEPTLWGPYIFSRQSPVIDAGTPIDPLCRNGTGSYTITAFNRLTESNETFRVTVRNVADHLSVFQSGEIQSSDLPLTISNLPPANYEAFAEARIGGNNASCGALIVRTFTISNPTQVTFTSSVTQPSCYGGTNGSVSLTASGGKGSGYQYSKNNGSNFQVSPAFNSLAAATYSMQVKDGNGCLSAAVPVPVTQPPDIIISSAAVTSDFKGQHISCFGSANGAITVSASGGTGALQYSHDGSPFQTSPVINGLPAGTYTLTVRDGNSCIRNSLPVVVTSPALITIGSTVTQPACFGQNNGSIALSGSGGTGTLQYSKDGGAFQADPLFINLPAGTYMMRAQDENLCVVQQTVIVTQPLGVTASGSASVVSCSGGSDGVVTLSATQGTAPYTYSFNGSAYGSGNTFTNVSASSYSISAKDSKGCIGSNTVTVSSNPVITGSITQQTAISCKGSSDGALNLTPGGGVGPYTYVWSTGSVSEDLAGLPAGTYTVTIKDSKNCTKDFNRTLTEPALISTSYNTSDYNGSNISCFDATNGSIDLNVMGGNGGYTYAWSNGPTTQDLTNLAAGTYIVTIKDSKNCPGNASVTLTQPPQLVTSLTAQQNILCFGGSTGSISLSSLGGTGVHEYSINSGVSWQVAQSFNGLAAANYAILTRDINNCQTTLNAALTSPPDIVLSVSNIVNTTCNQNNGSAQASATGGVASYNYEWFNSSNTSIGTTASINNLAAGTYAVTVTDQNACTKEQTVPISSSNGPQIIANTIAPATCSDTADGSATISITGGSTPYTILWPNNQTTATATNLTSGEYIVEVRDNTNCLALQTIIVPAPEDLLINTLIEEDPNCKGNSDGEITIEAAGGNGNYNYTWNTGGTTPSLTNIPAGTYTITVKDIKNCTEEKQIILVDPAELIVDLGPDQKICEGMNVTLHAAEDNATYMWSSTTGFSSTNQTVQLTEAGTYTLTVISAQGCEASDSFGLFYDSNLLKADFLMSSEAHAGDTVMLIDISWPLPDQTTWSYDPGAVIIEETQDYAMIRYDETGEYTVSLLARLAECVNKREGQLTIVAGEEQEDPEDDAQRLITGASAYPNPSPEAVSVSVDLSESREVILEVYQMMSGKRVHREGLQAGRAHLKAINLSMLPAGMYVLRIRAGREIREIKIMKQ